MTRRAQVALMETDLGSSTQAVRVADPRLRPLLHRGLYGLASAPGRLFELA